MERVVSFGRQEILMRASALTPRLYRAQTGRDLLSDIRQLQTAYADSVAASKDGNMSMAAVPDLTIFGDVAWIMAKQADPTVPDTVEEWLDSIDGVFSIYEIMPQIMDLWAANIATTSVSKKKYGRLCECLMERLSSSAVRSWDYPVKTWTG